MNTIAIIPARLAATRFPNKPMVDILGLPMIGHVYYRTLLCENITNVYVATCDIEIHDYINSIGGKTIMTSSNHTRATNRTAEALEIIEASQINQKIDGILMVQGDEPLLDPAVLDKLVDKHWGGNTPSLTNLVAKVGSDEDYNSANIVKVVLTNSGRIAYLSRAVIPALSMTEQNVDIYKQLGLIMFSNQTLRTFSKLSASHNEIIESIDMNRFIDNDINITSFITHYSSQAVDTPNDAIIVSELLKNDKYFKDYKGL